MLKGPEGPEEFAAAARGAGLVGAVLAGLVGATGRTGTFGAGGVLAGNSDAGLLGVGASGICCCVPPLELCAINVAEKTKTHTIAIAAEDRDPKKTLVVRRITA